MILTFNWTCWAFFAFVEQEFSIGSMLVLFPGRNCSIKSHLRSQLQEESMGHFQLVPLNRNKHSNDCFFDPLSTTKKWILWKHVSYSNLNLTFADMNSKTNQLSQKSHQWSGDNLHWLCCEHFQDFHHFSRLKVSQTLAGPHMTFHPLWNVNTTCTLESYLKLLP